jgi:hypothetical protein
MYLQSEAFFNPENSQQDAIFTDSEQNRRNSNIDFHSASGITAHISGVNRHLRPHLSLDFALDILRWVSRLIYRQVLFT